MAAKPGTVRRLAGFTLVEMVVGMVVLAIALVLIATLLFPLGERAALSVHRAKSAQLGQAVLAQMAGRRVDRDTPAGGGRIASLSCCDQDSSVCAQSGTAPADWTWLDQFHGYQGTPQALLGNDHYQQFTLAIQVQCLSDSAWPDGVKAVDLSVTAPDGEVFLFTQLRGNY
ncbi:type IV pilus modification PilV family protein [Ferrimonas marina]|uniref:MSHA pilin protein MshD n=1 Tax=Ferrimonas marina TaxID=299255 RepID=A0A1M5Y0U1_9GAMM|nr:type II secretion system protein [Ferrimonas marina]SHI05612.1 MSHA pilin protein MshD [Ferrimonas marina]